MRVRKTSRVLNDESYFLGLSYNDISGAGIFLLVLIMIGKMIGIQSQLWALVATVSILVFLIPVRLKYRRKIIRDSFRYLFTKGVINVSKNRRIK